MERNIMLEKLFDIIRANGVRKTAREAGIGLRTIENWLYKGKIPSIVNAERVLEALGYELTLKHKEKN